MFNSYGSGMGGYSLSDIAAATGGNSRGYCEDGFGGGFGAWWIIILFLFVFMGGGWGNRGWGNGGGESAALTRGELCQDFNFQDLQSAVRGIAADTNANFRTIDNAVCTLGYNSAQLANGIQMQVANGFGTLDTSLCQLGNNIAQQFNSTQIAQLQGQNALQSQLASCCCDIRSGIAETNYNNAMNTNMLQNAVQSGFCQTNFNAQANTRDIIEAQNANTRAILDKLTAQEIAAKDAQIAAQSQALFAAELKASQEAQNNYLVNRLAPCPIPAYQVANPNCAYSLAQFASCGCGCN